MILNVICLTIYLIIVVKVKKHKNTVAKSRRSQSSVRTAVIKLTIYSFCMYAILFVYSMFQLYMTTMPGEQDHYKAIMAWNGINDVYSWSNPWFILIFSKPTREYMYKMVTCGSNNNSQNVKGKARKVVKVTPPEENKGAAAPRQRGGGPQQPPGEIEMVPILGDTLRSMF